MYLYAAMQRKQFIYTIGGIITMGNLSGFKQYTDDLKEQDSKMPVLFIGHGSPMNGIENNSFSRQWETMGKELPAPKAVLVISAHWLTNGTHITAMDHPKTIHDFGGFPQELFEVQYPAPGDALLAKETQELIKSTNIGLNHDWGLDHGAWTVVRRMYPDATIPVLQLSIDYSKPAQYHYNLAKELAALRKKGVLIIGSGNMIHNLRMVAWDKLDKPGFGYDWAIEMHELFRKKISEGDHQALINYESLSKSARLAIPTPDHYYPLMYILGLQEKNETPYFFNDQLVAGSLNMTSVKFG
ncbi:MAG TPA: 4,5-DOPA dioxygenase extradiol [Chitinophagaceae bacterium]|nr:4,5-DOPA dioxygenase extradiol [Chitinophagaceae bacterium]